MTTKIFWTWGLFLFIANIGAQDVRTVGEGDTMGCYPDNTTGRPT